MEQRRKTVSTFSPWFAPSTDRSILDLSFDDRNHMSIKSNLSKKSKYTSSSKLTKSSLFKSILKNG